MRLGWRTAAGVIAAAVFVVAYSWRPPAGELRPRAPLLPPVLRSSVAPPTRSPSRGFKHRRVPKAFAVSLAQRLTCATASIGRPTLSTLLSFAQRTRNEEPCASLTPAILPNLRLVTALHESRHNTSVFAIGLDGIQHFLHGPAHLRVAGITCQSLAQDAGFHLIGRDFSS